jgi:hypothetical protein
MLSLQALWIRNMLQNATAQESGRQSSTNFVYSCPTILLLSSFIMALVSGETTSVISNDKEARIASMKEMMSTYTSNFPILSDSAGTVVSSGGDIIFITGTTGGLGCHLLLDAWANDSVARIYAFNRRKAEPLAYRQRRALLEHGLETSIVDSPKVVLLEGDLTEDFFGLDQNVYRDVVSTDVPSSLVVKILISNHVQFASITHIIHNGMHPSHLSTRDT